MKKQRMSKLIQLPIYSGLVLFVASIVSGYMVVHQQYWKISGQNQQNILTINSLLPELEKTKQRLIILETEDQRVKNQQLEKDLKETKEVFAASLKIYEQLNDAEIDAKSRTVLERQYAAVLKQIRDMEYASAAASTKKLEKDISAAVLAFKPKGLDISTLQVATAPPGSGYARQKVVIDSGEYAVDIATGDLSSTRVIVDTASNETCSNNCPVLPLGDYAARNGAWAAINGSYFCPESYPSCAGKTNSFDLLLMNKNKVYFNSDNNVYSSNPAVIFSGSSVRFVGRASEWGRDTSIDSMISNYPLLVMNKATQFGGNDDGKMNSAGSRSFVASKGNTVYIGVIRGVTVVQAAKVLQALGMDHAMNLDSGGSTAMWVNGSYKAGPGRNIPNAILFIRK